MFLFRYFDYSTTNDIWVVAPRLKAMNALIKIHQAGFALSDVFDFDDLVYNKDHTGESLPMFVNFANAHKHECPFTGEAIKAYKEIPPDAHSRWRGCIVLTMAYFEAGLWNPSKRIGILNMK